MGEEIATQLAGKLDVFCTAIGSGGALMGTLAGLHNQGLNPDVVAIEPAESPLLTSGMPGAHPIEGVAVFPQPPFPDRSVLNKILTIGQNRAFEMCRRLAQKKASSVAAQRV